MSLYHCKLASKIIPVGREFTTAEATELSKVARILALLGFGGAVIFCFQKVCRRCKQ